ncbi:phosphotransferase enzyme family protein [Gleimia hominis]|uniref:phosphotransferase enzyme family protein n=1 Tax=Gleimia hominis TaxID=595468 RepID=UPI000C7F7ADB|nr:aminoglycoside phosphotransferase family protein [Gleimia hominis]WIK64403.1 aminoglycoside phosphotransferase family protein [Gleimia hominis]
MPSDQKNKSYNSNSSRQGTNLKQAAAAQHATSETAQNAAQHATSRNTGKATADKTRHMDKDEQMRVVDPIWPAMTSREIKAVTSASKVQVVQNSNRPMAAGSLADADGQRVFLKRYDPTLVPTKTLKAVHKAVNQAIGNGLRAPRFLPFPNGETIAFEGPWVYEMCQAARGEDRYRNQPSWSPPFTRADAREVGRTVARVRLAMETVGTPEPREIPQGPYQNRFTLMLAQDLPEAVDKFLEARPEVAQYLAHTGRDLLADLAPLEPLRQQARAVAGESLRWTHGDLHVSNTFWDGHRVSDVIDFGLAYLNPPIFDLALALERHAIDWISITEGARSSTDADTGTETISSTDADAITEADGNTDATTRSSDASKTKESDAHAGPDTPTPGVRFRPQVAKDILAGYSELLALSSSEKRALGPMIALSHIEFSLDMIRYAAYAPAATAGLADWAYDFSLLGHSRWFLTGEGHQF